MIRYDLKCSNGHGFDSWFASSQAFDRLQGAGTLNCPHCGSSMVEKALMAPAVRADREIASPRPTESVPESAAEKAGQRAPTLSPAPADDRRSEALAALRREIERKSEYVGLSFASEARRIHTGDAPERMIHGEAGLDEARALIDEGVPIAPLPFIPTRRTN